MTTEDLDGPVVLGDRYELCELLGRGGMAEVHKARDRMLGRTVAVKLLPAERRDDNIDTRRLQDEARAAASLNHPNAVAVHDVGSSPHGVFVVMEHLVGRTWRDELARRGRLSEADVVEPGAAVCDALAAAHDLGIVHRDVNPGNVMILSDGVAKLMDFGIARAGAASPELTATGVVIGTAAYMSPEQVRDRPLDGRSDVYSLGCTLYELLTGQLPFGGTSSVEVASARLRESPPPPRRLTRDVSPGMEELVMRALAPEPARRPDARAMAAALRALASSDADRSAPSASDPAGSHRSRHDAPAPDEGTTTRIPGGKGAARATGSLDDLPDAHPPSAEGPAVATGMRRLGWVLVALGIAALVAAVVLLLVLGGG